MSKHTDGLLSGQLRLKCCTHFWPRTGGWVISLGGGTVETPTAREALIDFSTRQGGKVVWVQRELSMVESYLEQKGQRPAYCEEVWDVFTRREPWFRQSRCACYEFCNYTMVKGDTENEVERFFRHDSGLKPNFAPNVAKAAQGVRSYFLSLAYSDITPASADIPELTIGVDALELRVDLLRDGNSTNSIRSHVYVSQQVSALRHCDVPPYHVHCSYSCTGWRVPDDASREAVDLLKLALCLGCEYIDVETTLLPQYMTEIVSQKGASQIIAFVP